MSPLGYMAVSALLWSTFPVAVALGVSTFDFVLLYTAAIGISASLHLLIVSLRFRHFLDIFRANRRLLLTGSALAGGAITIASFSYYAAMQSPNKLVPAILLELWPILSMFFGVMMSKKANWSRMPGYVWLCALAALVGTAILSANGGLLSGTRGFSVWIALLGAVFYGLSGNLQAFLGARLTGATEAEKTLLTRFFSDGVAFLAALCVIAIQQRHAPVTIHFWLEALYLGTVVYALSAFLFNHGLRQAESPSINLLFYFSPVLSIFWLDLLGYGRLTGYVLLGSALILSANVIVLSEYRYAPSTIYTLIATLFFAVVVAQFQGCDLNEPTGFVAISAEIFAIIAGFSLTRLHGRNAAEEQLRLEIANRSFSLVDLARGGPQERESSIRRHVDDLLIRITDYKYCVKPDQKPQLLEALYASEKRLTLALSGDNQRSADDESRKVLYQLFEILDRWVSRKAERLSLGEVLSLALIGCVAIGGLVLNRSTDLYSSLSSIFISTGIAFTFFKIIELDFGHMDVDFSSILSEQHLFRRLGTDFYLPHSVVVNRAFPAPPQGVVFRHFGSRGEILVTAFKKEFFLVRNMAFILFAVASFAVFAALLEKFHFIKL